MQLLKLLPLSEFQRGELRQVPLVNLHQQRELFLMPFVPVQRQCR
jgi:hypothetical protein